MARSRLTVLQVLPALDGGGVERGTVDMAAALTRAGHRSLVISKGGRLLPELESTGSTHIAWPVGEKSLSSLRLIAHLRQLFYKQPVDVLHARSRVPAWIAYLAWRSTKQPLRPHLVTTVHGYYSVNRYSAIMTRGERVIAVSNGIRDYVLDHYPAVNPDRVRVIPRGVDRERFPNGYRPSPVWLEHWHRTHPSFARRFVITLPGRLTRLKGHEDFINIVAALRSDGVPVHGLLVGGTAPGRKAYEEELRTGMDRAGITEHMSLMGHRSDLRDIMAVSDAILSLSHRPEAFGRTTLEALSLGRPVAGYDHGGVGEQLEVLFPQGRIPVGDIRAMVRQLSHWYQQPPSVPDHHEFTLQRMQDSTLGLYDELAGKP